MNFFLSPQTISAKHLIQKEIEKKKELERAEKYIKQEIQLVLNFYDQEEEHKPNRKLLIIDWDNINLYIYYSPLKEKLIKELEQSGWKVFETTIITKYRETGIKYTRWYFVPQNVEINRQIIDGLKSLPFNKRDYFMEHRFPRDSMEEIDFIGGDYKVFNANNSNENEFLRNKTEFEKKEN